MGERRGGGESQLERGRGWRAGKLFLHRPFHVSYYRIRNIVIHKNFLSGERHKSVLLCL